MQEVGDMRVFATAAACAALLSGCASTPEGLKANPDNRRAATVPVGYQLAFKRITETLRECSSSPLLPFGQVINDARLYPDLKQGTLTLGASGVGTQIWQHLEVNAAGDETQLVLFSAAKPQANLDRYARWANGSTSCEI